MPDQPEKDTPNTGAIDLSALESLSFGPNWGSGETPKTTSRDRGDDRPRGKRSGGSGRGERSGGNRPGGGKDRRPDRPPRRRDGAGQGHEGERPRRGGGRGGDKPQGERPLFHPIVEVLFYPADEPFKALSKAIRDSRRTFELFEVARAILDKEERFVVVLQPRKDAAKKDTLPQKFFVSQPDYIPFEREEDAVGHVIANHLDTFFEIEEVEVEPPKGNFPFVNRCGVTGVLLGPPNYHRYQQLVQEHHAARLAHMPFSRFESRIEQVKDEAVVQEWVDSMKKLTRYRVRDRKDGEPEVIESMEGVRLFLINHRGEAVVREQDQARFPGAQIQNMPQSGLRRSVESALEQQRRFPLDTANNLRGRLRRMNFTIYKRGSKGVSWVSGVKRKFRDEGTVFAESLQQLIDFIEHHPNIRVGDLPEQFLGLEIKSAGLKTANAEAGEEPTRTPREVIADEAPATAETPAETTAGAEAEAAQEPKAEAAEATEQADTTQPAEAEKPAEAEAAAPAPEKTEKPKKEPFANHPPEERKLLKQMMSDLQWLVSEGYVTEFGDGTLFAPPPNPAPKKEEQKPAKPKAEAKPADGEDKAETVETTEAPEPEAKQPEAPEEKPADAAPAEPQAKEAEVEDAPTEAKSASQPS